MYADTDILPGGFSALLASSIIGQSGLRHGLTTNSKRPVERLAQRLKLCSQGVCTIHAIHSLPWDVRCIVLYTWRARHNLRYFVWLTIM